MKTEIYKGYTIAEKQRADTNNYFYYVVSKDGIILANGCPSMKLAKSYITKISKKEVV